MNNLDILLSTLQGTSTTGYISSNYFYTGNGIMNLINSFATSCEVRASINDSMTDEQIKDSLKILVKDFTELLDIIEKRKLNNEQWCLDGMDEINKQSVRF